MAIRPNINSYWSTATSAFKKNPHAVFVTTFVLWVLFVILAGCDGAQYGDLEPPDTTDHAAHAKLTIKVELDYHVDVGMNDWTIREWDKQVLHGDRSGDCT